jgi:hypothetical protein
MGLNQLIRVKNKRFIRLMGCNLCVCVRDRERESERENERECAWLHMYIYFLVKLGCVTIAVTKQMELRMSIF